MNFISMALHTIGNANTMLANLGTAIEHNTLGRRRHRARANPIDDVEMDIMLDADTALTRADVLTVSEPRFSGLQEFVNDPIRFLTRRPRALRDFKEVAHIVMILLVIALFTTTILPNFANTVHWLAGSVLGSADDSTTNSIHVFSEYASLRAAQYAKATATTSPSVNPVYVPGFYMAHVDDSTAGIWQTVSATADPAVSSSTRKTADLNVKDLSAVHKHAFAHHGHDENKPVHHAYPLHAGKIANDLQTQKIKTELKYCIEVLNARLKDQVLDTTPTFEFALHHCKSTISYVLDTLFPGRPAPAGMHLSKRSIDEEDVAAVSVNKSTPGPNNVTAECEWKRPRSALFGRSCSKGFCDWVSASNIARCYHKDEKELKKSGKVVFLNESVDDFKDDAPLECNLCLPRRDCDGIDSHCESVEKISKDVTTGLLIGGIIGGTVLCFMAWLCFGRPCGRAAAAAPEEIEMERRGDGSAAPPPAA